MKVEIDRQKMKINNVNYPHYSYNTISYVEKLLDMSLEDHRKFARALILAPYFVNIQHSPDSNSFNKIKQWTFSKVF